MKTQPYDAFTIVMAIKAHFTTKYYDYIKYNGKMKLKYDSFKARRDVNMFNRLGKKYTQKEILDLAVANAIKGKFWVGDLLSEDGHDNYADFVKKVQSFTYTFKNELEGILSEVENPSDVFKVVSGEYPMLVNKHLSGDLSIESLAVLNKYFAFFDKFDEAMGKNDAIWGKIRNTSNKLLPFVQHDKEKVVGVLKDLFLQKTSNK